MQSRQLHASLHAFAAAAGATLAAEVAGGDEIGFEVVEEGARGSRPGLYCYEPLTAEFVERHWASLLRLPEMRAAQLALAALDGLEEYLDTYAEEHRAGAPVEQDALRCFTRRVFDGAGEDFELEPERFEPAYRELAAGAGAQAGELAVLALLRGIDCESAEITLGEGVMLAPLAQLDVLPPDPAWRRDEGPRTVLAARAGRRTRRDRRGARAPARPPDRTSPLRPRHLARAAGMDPRPARQLARAAHTGRGTRRRGRRGIGRPGGRASRVREPRRAASPRGGRAGVGARALRARPSSATTR